MISSNTSVALRRAAELAISDTLTLPQARSILDQEYLLCMYNLKRNKSEVARRSGIHRNTVIRKLRRIPGMMVVPKEKKT